MFLHRSQEKSRRERRRTKTKNDIVVFNIIWTEPSDPLDYAAVLEHYHLAMSALGGHGCRL